jgi:hypothetical protein
LTDFLDTLLTFDDRGLYKDEKVIERGTGSEYKFSYCDQYHKIEYWIVLAGPTGILVCPALRVGRLVC